MIHTLHTTQCWNACIGCLLTVDYTEYILVSTDVVPLFRQMRQRHFQPHCVHDTVHGHANSCFIVDMLNVSLQIASSWHRRRCKRAVSDVVLFLATGFAFLLLGDGSSDSGLHWCSIGSSCFLCLCLHEVAFEEGLIDRPARTEGSKDVT